MIYVSIDVETTGLDRENDQVLEFGAIIEDTSKQLNFEEIPKFKAILNVNRISGSAYALKMNQRIIDILADRPSIFSEDANDYKEKHNIVEPFELGEKFAEFLYKNGFSYGGKLKIVAAGKNFDSFDKQFICRLPDFEKFVTFHHRSINPAEYFIDFINDKVPPSLEQCLERAGYKNSKITHNALLDAWDVIRVMRTQYSYKNTWNEFYESQKALVNEITNIK